MWVSIAGTGLAMLHNAGEISVGFIFFLVWSLSPYVGLILGDAIIRRIGIVPKMTLVFCVASILMLLFTFFAYVGSLADKSSTHGLIFVFAPLYLNVAVVFIVGGGLIWAALLKASKK